MRTGARSPFRVLLVLLFGVTAVAQTPAFSDQQFLTRAAQRVREYITAFHNLTAEETATVGYYEQDAYMAERHRIVSSLVIYRSQADPAVSVEYRDVVSVDGKKIRDHGARAMKLLRRAMDSKTVAEELAKISQESNRYNPHASTVNNTLRQGLPLLPECLSAFQFAFEGNEDVRGAMTRVYRYEQIKPCGAFDYKLDLPADFEIAPLAHAGKLWLDSSTARLVREERTVFAQTRGDAQPSKIAVLSAQFDYQPGKFDILVPASIRYRSYTPVSSGPGKKPQAMPRVLLEQTYGPFLRFEVSVKEKVNVPLPK